MKITQIDTIPVKVPIIPERAIRGGHTESPFLLVRIHTDEGIEGLGEVFCTPIWSGEDQVAAAGLVCTVGSNLELGIGNAAMIHLAMATPAVDAETFPCDILSPFFYETDLLQEPLSIRAGEARPPTDPGLGIQLDEDQVAFYRTDKD